MVVTASVVALGEAVAAGGMKVLILVDTAGGIPETLSW